MRVLVPLLFMACSVPGQEFDDPVLDTGLDDLPMSQMAPPTVTVTGKLSFEPDYSLTDGTTVTADLGQIPGTNNSYAKMRLLFVCAYDADGAVDFSSVTDTPFSGNDDLLGCAAADRDGLYEITFDDLSYGDDVYLLTWFCDGADFDLTSRFGETFEDDAEVCVRLDVDSEPTTSDDATGRHRKFLRSRVYTNELTTGTNVINWNLSCPNVSGLASTPAYLDCPMWAEEPRTNSSCQDRTNLLCGGDTNSNWFWNQEASHIFRAAIEPVKTFGTLKPISSRVAPTTTPCTGYRCQDEISLTISQDLVPLGPGDSRHCSDSSNNSSSHYNKVCITHNNNGDSGTHNPFRVVHEIGHNLHRRWMKDSSKVAQGCAGSGWATGEHESINTSEGFANFVASASWYNDDRIDPTYDGFNVEPANDADLAGSCGASGCGCSEGDLLGEGRPTQFFWDLYDENDSTDISFWDIMRTWSALPNGTGDGQTNECGPDGRNLEDFYEAYNALLTAYPTTSPYSGWPTIWGTRNLNCADKHINGQACDPACIGGDCPAGVCD